LSVTVERVRQRAEADARAHGVYLNPDQGFLGDLIEGLRKNEERYGYPSCPCRPATGSFDKDRDIICPCDYRDPDVAEYGQCYCSLYVDKKTHDSGETRSIPERRPPEKMFPEEAKAPKPTARRLWYCRQCGYVAFREEPPYVCPICRARRELFSELSLPIEYRAT
jgi:ferredoxin-thioredoxin reductase catalytic chain